MQGETGSILGPPPEVGARRPSYDPDWYEKIERAMQAREIGKKLQKSARTRSASMRPSAGRHPSPEPLPRTRRKRSGLPPTFPAFGFGEPKRS